MTLPRFTPDALPDGLDPELAAYLQRQFDRINDWWPKDLEGRVEALERANPILSGSWPIIDASSVSFFGESKTAYPECFLTSPILQTGSYTWPNNDPGLQSFDIKPDGTRIYCAASANGGLGPGIYYYDLSIPYDVSTASFAGKVYLSSQHLFSANGPMAIKLSHDESYAYTIDWAVEGSPPLGQQSVGAILQHPLTIPGDITSIIEYDKNDPVSTVKVYKYPASINKLINLTFSADGKFIYGGQNGSPIFHQFNLATAWDLDSISYVGSVNLSAQYGASGYVKYAHVDPAGKTLYLGRTASSMLFIYRLATAHDLTTISYVESLTFNGNFLPEDVIVGSDCGEFIFLSNGNNKFTQYGLTITV